MLHKFFIVTDDYGPDSKVGRIYDAYKRELESQDGDHKIVKILEPSQFKGKRPTVRSVAKIIEDFCPDYIHIATEGKLGYLTRRYCGKKRYKFSTASHTVLDIHGGCKWFGFELPDSIKKKYLKWFHGEAETVLIRNNKDKGHYKYWLGQNEYVPWDPFVDLDEFSTKYKTDKPVEFKGVDPIKDYILYVGDISKERNLSSFCCNDNAYRRILLVGDGDKEYIKELQEKHPHVHCAGELQGDDLKRAYANARVFAYPCDDRAAGFAPLEAIASGVPVACLKSDFASVHIKAGKNGYADDDIVEAINLCLNNIDMNPREYTETTNEDPCHRYSLHYSSLTFFATLNSRYL